MDKHSSLLQKSVNYGRRKFYNTDPSRKNKFITEVFLYKQLTLQLFTVQSKALLKFYKLGG